MLFYKCRQTGGRDLFDVAKQTLQYCNYCKQDINVTLTFTVLYNTFATITVAGGTKTDPTRKSEERRKQQAAKEAS